MDDTELSACLWGPCNLRSLSKPNNEKKADNLINKMKLSPNDTDNEKRPTRSMNFRGQQKCPEKINRKIELGWIHEDKHINT